MYEYIEKKTKAFVIGNKWVFFDKGQVYDEGQKNFAVRHGVEPNSFIAKENKVVKEEIKQVQEEEKQEEVVQEEVVVKKSKKKRRK